MEGDIMTKALSEVQDVFSNRVNQICSKFGLNNVMAQLYAILYLSNRTLSLNELAEVLKISKGSASINIRALEEYGAVRRIWVKGSRKNYYEAEPDITKVIMDRLKSMAQRRLSEIQETLDTSYQVLEAVNPLDKENKEDIDVLKERLDKLRNFHIQALSLFNLFNTGLLNNVLNNSSIKDSETDLCLKRNG